LNFRYVIQISLFRVLSYGDRPPVKSAILATDSTIIHYSQLHAIITEESPIRVRIFQKREEAAQWLGVPLQRLASKNTPGAKVSHEAASRNRVSRRYSSPYLQAAWSH